ncbi:uncharacterized protein LAESUDRAFT_682687 [Laetiporus sulphureus 93-53]|uniref:RING-type domain-containing protein n=1 Tax=Laetiporus sulphureus 93-53 TaxID=1314785 RepID=A0A165DBM2_9APHY|nr:uncharacterized protein LAESUDRAFT_682687 [Laetiporus sulphureus 93-53]KZT04492.1 hypothetical protein LAESUDRAFT_682687 [Laetiporus sulphureus 93-53]
MATIATWYNNQYSTWNRTRRLHAQPYLARTDTSTSRRAAEMAQQMAAAQDAVVLNMGNPNGLDANKEKTSDTLFGPNIGIVSGGPEWTERHEKSSDELTPEIIKNWIARSKEGFPTTTTLQALVNLKRPTLRLTPFEDAPSDDPDHADSQHHHGLEFEYDCDAPKCGISVNVLLSPRHHLAGKADASGLYKFLVYESVVDGGFGKVLKHEDGATLELGRFELCADDPEKDTAAESSVAVDAEGQQAPEDNHTKRLRFTHFNFRKRSQNRNVAGPALAVVDAETHATEGEESDSQTASRREEPDVGVRVTIRLAALDGEGHELPSVNEQVTYLHIVRYGPPPVSLDGQVIEDNRPWVVKVVKREATIGPHTFHLHEIYGLSANSTTPSQPVPTSPTSAEQHVYPPVPPPGTTQEEEPSSECLLCLSSPREVVLLPCRHLVACRECALNMIEFGAGGTIVQQDNEPSATTGPDDTAGDGTNVPTSTSDGALPGSEAVAAPPVPRRKRKAKGWFCPVCRQPYTSMLRITTVPPSKEDEMRDSMSTDVHVERVPASPPAQSVRGSLTASFPRPGALLRAFGRSSAQQPDVERGQVQA